MNIRRAQERDLSRIAEIFVYNNRLNYLPIFKDVEYSFNFLQVVDMADGIFRKRLPHMYVYDDGIVRGFIDIEETEICKLYVDSFFQGHGYGADLLDYAIKEHSADFLWALEKNTRAILFYENHGFHENGERKKEEDTEEYLLKLTR